MLLVILILYQQFKYSNLLLLFIYIMSQCIFHLSSVKTVVYYLSKAYHYQSTIHPEFNQTLPKTPLFLSFILFHFFQIRSRSRSQSRIDFHFFIISSSIILHHFPIPRSSSWIYLSYTT